MPRRRVKSSVRLILSDVEIPTLLVFPPGEQVEERERIMHTKGVGAALSTFTKS